jgi:hypothetical protein
MRKTLESKNATGSAEFVFDLELAEAEVSVSA